jgi:hypothetical protein
MKKKCMCGRVWLTVCQIISFFLGKQLNHISHLPLQLAVALWLSSGQWNMRERTHVTSGLSTKKSPTMILLDNCLLQIPWKPADKGGGTTKWKELCSWLMAWRRALCWGTVNIITLSVTNQKPKNLNLKHKQ